ncbi:MAG: serine--tRNA ligase [Candidatus Bipolaricaulota bacterium]|nr:serine--tRNA ligase [Candidatus Bipolaricaulota bacterium]
MLDIHKLREDPKGIEERLQTRDSAIDLSEILGLDEKRLELIQRVETLKAERNEGSQAVGRLKKEGKDASKLIDSLSNIGRRIASLDDELKEAAARIEYLLALLPNVPHSSVPVGVKEEKVILRSVGEKPEPDFPMKNHLEIGEEKGILDFRRAAMIAGARFPMYVGLGAMLEMALIQFMFFHHAKNDYIPVFPPFLANPESFYVSSQLPKFADEDYYCEKDDLYLTPTAETLLANLHREEILLADDLPKRYVAYTPCFRREAGTYGEEERGLIRVHQFNKVEMFKFTDQESSYAELEGLIVDAEGVLQALGIHYRVALLPTQDLAQQATKTVDLEVYLPGQGRYYEVSSCSNCEDFQARRGNMRYRPAEGEKPVYLHTLNGSGLATTRLMAAILENNQTPDGRVRIPEVLQEMVGEEFL